MKRNMALIRRIAVAALALLLAAGSLSAQTAQEKKAREGRLIDARTAMDLGDYRTAEKILTELSRQPDNDAALYYLAVIELGTKRFAAAQEHFARAAAIDPGNFWYRDALAVAYSMDGKDEKTVETYEQLLKDFPDRNDLWFNLVNLYLKLKRNDRALEAMDQIETLYGKNEAVTSTRYDLLMQDYKADEALQVLADYNESNPSPVIRARMGDHVMSQAKDSLARSYYEQALALQPDYSPALLGLAECCRIRRDFPGYFSTLDTFVGNADIPAGYKSQYLGRLLGLVFSQEDAAFLQTFRPQLDSLIGTAVTLHPADSAVVSTAGAYYNSTGRGGKAIEVFGRNKDLHPDSPGARLTWIQTLAYNGRMDDAAAQCDSAIARFPGEYAFYELKNAVLYNRQDEDGLLANCQAILDRFGDDRQTTVAKMEAHMVNFTSPAARRPEDSGPENGWTSAEKRLWIATMIRIRRLVSPDRSYSGRRAGVRAITITFHTTARASDRRVSFRIYHSAASVSPAPMHCPTTVINTVPMETPMQAARDQNVWPVVLAAIWDVPKVATSMPSTTLAAWNRVFSTEFGIATLRIRLDMEAFSLNTCPG